MCVSHDIIRYGGILLKKSSFLHLGEAGHPIPVNNCTHSTRHIINRRYCRDSVQSLPSFVVKPICSVDALVVVVVVSSCFRGYGARGVPWRG